MRQPRRVVLVAAWLIGLASASLAQPAPAKQPNVDHMLDALKTAPDEGSAVVLEGQVEQAWIQAGTPAVTLLMSQGLRLLQAGQNDNATESFSDAITLSPDLAEAWHQRAIARYRAGDPSGAVLDLQETLKREPRDFAAFRTLANIAASREDWKSAYAAWQKVMELDPKTPGGDARLKELKRKAVGEDT
jgi:tetratricopeptide (TPR) repeat protein